MIYKTNRLKIGKNYTDKLIKEIAKKSQKKEGGNDVILEMIENENKALIRKGRREGRRETLKYIAKKMLQEKLDINIIMKVTGLTEKQILK